MAVECIEDYLYGRGGPKLAGYFLGKRLYNSSLKKARGGRFILSKLSTFCLQKFVFRFVSKTESTLVIPTGAVMNNLSELITFKGTEDARNFFYRYENVVTKSLPEIEKAEKIVAYLTGAAFNFYFDRFTLDNGPIDEAKDYAVGKKVMLEKLSIQKAESEIMRDALSLSVTTVGISQTSYQGPKSL